MTEQRSNSDLLAERLDVIVPPGRFEVPARDADALVDAAILVAAPAQPEPLTAAARARIRAQVLAAQPSPTRSPIRPNAIRWMMRWGLAAGIALVFLFIGLRPSVLASVPGDLLYPVKQTVEQAELSLAASAQDQAFVHMTHAERRAQEAITVVERGQLPDALMIQALDDMLSASQIARADLTLSTSTVLQLEARTAKINTLINAALVLAGQSDQIPQAEVIDLTQRIQATQMSGGLLLPDTVTPPSTTPTSEPSATASPLPTAEADSIPGTIVVEGPIQAITDDGIVIFGLEIKVRGDGPGLTGLQVGQSVRVEGSTEMQGSGVVIVAISIQLIQIEMTAAPASAPPPSGLPSNCRVSKNGKIKCSKRPR